jgi:hypothetical protein
MGLIRVPQSAAGKSLLEPSQCLVITKTEMMNMGLDAFNLAAMPMIEVDDSPGGIDPTDLEEGLYPGKFVRNRRMGAGPGMRPLKVGTIEPMTLPFVAAIDQEEQRATRISDSIRGTMPQKRGTTATQVSQSINLGRSHFNRYGMRIDRNFLSVVLDLSLKTLLENATEVKDYWLEREMKRREAKDPRWAGMYQRLAGMGREERVALLEKQVRVRAHGISNMLKNEQTLERLEKLAEAAGANPMMAQQIDWRVFLEKWTDALMLDSSDLLKSKEQVAGEAQQAMMMAAQQQAAGVGAGGGNGSSRA